MSRAQFLLPARRPATLRAAVAWLAISVWCSASGWGLSAVRQLSVGGYLVALALALAGAGWWWRRGAAEVGQPVRPVAPGRPWRRWRRRFRQPLPAIFLLAFTLALLGGLLHTPNNYDSLTYRFPQVLRWLDAGQWQWLETWNQRRNYSAVGFSWLLTPLFAFTRTDRLFALPNLLGLALMPGLVFAFLRGCGVRGRVAWPWMWLLPCGYGYMLQAGSVGNDLAGAIYALAALTFGLRAARTRHVGDASWAILALALATGVKATNLPLMLPLLVALWPAREICRRHWLALAGVVALAVLVSFAPTAFFNHRHTGHWSGDPRNSDQLNLSSPIHGLIGNTLQMGFSNAQPPVFPPAVQAGAQLNRLESSPALRALKRHFPRFNLEWRELPIEEAVGLGLGVTLLTLLALGATLTHWRSLGALGGFPGGWTAVATCVALAVFMTKVGSETSGRLALVYYPLALAAVLLPGVNASLVRRRWWRGLAIVAAASVLPALVLTPSRPLWPARTVTAELARRFPDSALLRRAATVYEVYGRRHDVLAPLRRHLPAGAREIGFAGTGDDSDVALWRPFGSRRVLGVLPGPEGAATLARLRGSMVVASRRGVQARFGQEPEVWTAAIGGRIVAREKITVKVSEGPEEWFVVALGAAGGEPRLEKAPG